VETHAAAAPGACPGAIPRPVSVVTGSSTVRAVFAPAASVPATSVPATSVPATSVPATSVPATSVPATSVPATSVPATRVSAVRVPALVGVVGMVLAACSSPSPASVTKGGAGGAGGVRAIDAAVLKAWRAAENAFYRAEASPTGSTDPALAATMVDPELELVERNLAANEAQGFIGTGSWDLGSPRVSALEPSTRPTKATVVSCIHDTAILVDEHTGRPVAGVAGTPDWLGATSTMELTSAGWKLSQQQAVGNASRAVACAGI
jgi:hypothetical protein